TMPDVGKIFNTDAKTKIIINPNQNGGIESNTYEIPLVNTSNFVPFFRAANIPRLVPIIAAIINPVSANKSVGQIFSKIKSSTGSLFIMEKPKSSLNKFVTYVTN